MLLNPLSIFVGEHHARLSKKLEQAEMIIDVQKKLSALLGLSNAKTGVLENPIPANGPVFYDATVQLGTATNQTQKTLRLVGYRVGNQTFWIATNRLSLSAEQIALGYKLRWDIECFFAWWKRHMRVYHLIARSPYGLLMQILAGLITYLLVAIYCHMQFDQKVNLERFRKIRIQIQNELRETSSDAQPHEFSDWAFSYKQ